MKIGEILTNLADSDPEGLDVYEHPIFGETIKIGIYLNPKSLRNFNKSKGFFVVTDSKEYLIIVEHKILPHGCIFNVLKESEIINKDSIICKIDDIDTTNKTLTINTYFNYPNYKNIIENLTNNISCNYKEWDINCKKHIDNVTIDYQFHKFINSY